MAIPTSSSDLTKEYLNSVLEDFQEIVKVDIKIPKTCGYMSNVKKLFLHYCPQDTIGISPSTIIAKYALPASENFMNKEKRSDLMRHGELYKREVRLNKILNGLDLLPKIFFTDCDEAQNYIILMEDCATENDVKEGSSNTVNTTLSVDQMFVAVKDIAKFHAGFYHPNDANRLDVTKGILCGNNDEIMASKDLSWLPEYFCFMYYTTFHLEFVDVSTSETFAAYNDESLRKIAKYTDDIWMKCYEFMINTMDFSEYVKFNIPVKLKAMYDSNISVEDRFYDAFKVLTEQAALTLVHGDFRADNMTFIEKDHLKLFDWQCGSLGSGLIDIMSLLYTSLDIDDRVNTEEKVLQEYVHVLHSNGCTWLTLENVRLWYSCALWYQIKNCLLFVQSIMNSSETEAVPGVNKDYLQKICVRQLTTIIEGVYRHCYS